MISPYSIRAQVFRVSGRRPSVPQRTHCVTRENPLLGAKIGYRSTRTALRTAIRAGHIRTDMAERTSTDAGWFEDVCRGDCNATRDPIEGWVANALREWPTLAVEPDRSVNVRGVVRSAPGQIPGYDLSGSTAVGDRFLSVSSSPVYSPAVAVATATPLLCGMKYHERSVVGLHLLSNKLPRRSVHRSPLMRSGRRRQVSRITCDRTGVSTTR